MKRKASEEELGKEINLFSKAMEIHPQGSMSARK
jgi:hypothetical protein